MEMKENTMNTTTIENIEDLPIIERIRLIEGIRESNIENIIVHGEGIAQNLKDTSYNLYITGANLNNMYNLVGYNEKNLMQIGEIFFPETSRTQIYRLRSVGKFVDERSKRTGETPKDICNAQSFSVLALVAQTDTNPEVADAILDAPKPLTVREANALKREKQKKAEQRGKISTTNQGLTAIDKGIYYLRREEDLEGLSDRLVELALNAKKKHVASERIAVLEEYRRVAVALEKAIPKLDQAIVELRGGKVKAKDDDYDVIDDDDNVIEHEF